jgi:hypothetical protein
MAQPVPPDTAIGIDDLVPVFIIWDAALGSPADLQKYAGMVVSVPPDRIPLPQRGLLFGVRGYSRQGVGGRWEWVLQGDVDPVDAWVDTLTGRPGGWVDQSARATVKLMAQRLYSAGLPRATIVSQFPQLVSAIATEVRAEIAADAEPPPVE